MPRSCCLVLCHRLCHQVAHIVRCALRMVEIVEIGTPAAVDEPSVLVGHSRDAQQLRHVGIQRILPRLPRFAPLADQHRGRVQAAEDIRHRIPAIGIGHAADDLRAVVEGILNAFPVRRFPKEHELLAFQFHDPVAGNGEHLVILHTADELDLLGQVGRHLLLAQAADQVDMLRRQLLQQCSHILLHLRVGGRRILKEDLDKQCAVSKRQNVSKGLSTVRKYFQSV